MASCLHFHKPGSLEVGPLSVTTMDEARKRISNFHLSGTLHDGQKSEVLSARYAQAGGVVQSAAVKVLKPGFACIGDELRCFLREINWARSVRHSLFPRILEAGEHEGNYFLAMERIDGWTLETVLRNLAVLQVALPLQVVLTLVHQIADGMQNMHEHCREETLLGLVHLGIEPGNIMIRRTGTALLLDFGETMASALGDVVVSSDRAAAYQAPERLRMLPLDCRADVYSLGRVLESMVACVDPAEVDAELQAVVAKASSTHAEERYGTMRELMDALERIAANRAMDFSCHTCSQFFADVFGDAEVQTDPRARRPRSAAAPMRMASEGMPTVCETPALPQVEYRGDTDTDAMGVPAPEADGMMTVPGEAAMAPENMMTVPGGPQASPANMATVPAAAAMAGSSDSEPTPAFADVTEKTESPKRKFVDEHLAVTTMAAPQTMEGLAASEEMTQISAAHVSAPKSDAAQEKAKAKAKRKGFPEELIATKAYSPNPDSDDELAVAIERLRH